MTETFSPGSDAVRDFEAFVISGDAEHFSVGANLMQLLLSAQEGEWDDVDFAVRAFQRMTAAIKFCPRPVVVAPYSFCLGGGAEIAMHGARRQAHAELYMGLVETGVGVVPGGGGCKEMLLRALDVVSAVHGGARGTNRRSCWARCGGPSRRSRWPRCRRRRWRRASSACCCRRDRITMNRERLLHDAKESARELAASGYSAPVPRTDIPAPGENMLASLKLGVHVMRQGEFISDHDVKVANWVAYVLCGGPVTPGHAGERAVFAGSGARGVPLAVRREEDAGADRVHAEERAGR